MPDALQELAQETIKELLAEWPLKERLKGMSVDDLLAALTPEMRAALVQRIKDDNATTSPPPGGQTPESKP